MPVLTGLDHPRCWQQAISIVVDTYHLSSNGNLILDLNMKDQLRKTALSIASHTAEGKEGRNPSQCIKSLYSAKASAEVLRILLAISREAGYLAEGDLLEFEDKILRLLSTIDSKIRSLKRRL